MRVEAATIAPLHAFTTACPPIPMLRTALAALCLLLSAAISMALPQQLPLRFQGDGLTLVVTELNEDTAKVAGTLQLGNDAALPFALDLTLNSKGLQLGKGKVQGPVEARRISTRENQDGSIRVSYRAKRYVVSLVEGPATTPAPNPPPKGSSDMLRLRKHSFNDPQFGGRPSHTMLVPIGWKVEGGAYWAPQPYYMVMPTQEIVLTSPSGVSVRIDPTLVAKDFTPPAHLGMQRPQEGTSDNGTPIIYFPTDLMDWKKAIETKLLPQTLLKARNISVRDVQVLPELTAAFTQRNAQMKAMHMQNGAMEVQMGGRVDYNCWVLGFESRYTLEGVDYEEFRLMAVTALTTDNPMMGHEVNWTIDRDLSFRAPVGTLAKEMPVLCAIANSVQETMPWIQSRAAYFAKILGIDANRIRNSSIEARKRSNIMAKAYSDANQISMDGYRSRAASSANVQAQVVRSINETELYRAPSTTEVVQLPSGYDHVYTNGLGEYVLTNDGFVNPSTDLGPGNWTAMGAAGSR